MICEKNPVHCDTKTIAIFAQNNKSQDRDQRPQMATDNRKRKTCAQKAMERKRAAATRTELTDTERTEVFMIDRLLGDIADRQKPLHLVRDLTYVHSPHVKRWAKENGLGVATTHNQIHFWVKADPDTITYLRTYVCPEVRAAVEADEQERAAPEPDAKRVKTEPPASPQPPADDEKPTASAPS